MTKDQKVPLPWQQALWEQFIQAYHHQKLSHAILLADREGFGQSVFAKALARYILCDESNLQQAHLFDQGHHPDFFYCQPQQDSQVIKIDAIRELQNRLSHSASLSQARVVIVEPADALNAAASNALLKLLEEPGANIFFILISSSKARLSKTVLSRCQRFYFARSVVMPAKAGIQTIPPAVGHTFDKGASPVIARSETTKQSSLSWLIEKNLTPTTAAYFLKLAEGAPLTALAFAEKSSQQFRKDFLMDLNQLVLSHLSPMAVAEKWSKQHSLNLLLEWLYRWLLDVIRLHHEALEEASLPAPYVAILKGWQQKLNLNQLFEMMQGIHQCRCIASAITGLNAQNSLESILIDL